MRDLMQWVGVPEAEQTAVLASPPDEHELAAAVAGLRRDLGSLDSSVTWRAASGTLPLYAYLTVLPEVLAWHAARRVPRAISHATMHQLGSRVRDGGVVRPYWFSRHFRGSLYRLGRLQFDRTARHGEPLLDVHIPGDGHLTPEACDDSLAAARPFFAEHFPAEEYKRAYCTSWLLDPQLADYLPEDSNILRFQRRFTTESVITQADDDIRAFVFDLPSGAELPRRTRLEAAIADHLAEGKHWHHVTGWLPL
ncbi:acyltransferase [Kribbella antibiotica]|uniref:Acyltransferase n=1 Tax=Kribbella antibiotica TaxID=190195 RepID=A0A4R4ZLF7_9ACTN|nr:acyltransferase domain-containing protein [Kribbella antibiotica]TDD59638.1 acyltransferase [Kribbella antibiotica]